MPADNDTPAAPPPPQPPSLARMAFSGAAWLSALNGIAGLITFALLSWLNHVVPDAPVRLGVWNVVLPIILMASLIFDGGIGNAVMQRRDIPMGAIAALSWLQILLGLTAASLLFFLAGPLAALFPKFDQHELASAFRLASPALLFIAAGMPAKTLLQKDLRFRAVATIESSATMALIIAGFAFGRTLGATALIVGMLIRHGLESLLYWVFGPMRVRDLFTPFDREAVAERLRFGISMGLQSLLGTAIRQGDRVLVSILAGPVAGNLYGQLQSLAVQPYAKLTIYVSRAAFPTFVRAQDDAPRLLRGLTRMQRLEALLVFPTLLGMAAVAPRLFGLYFGAQYAEHMAVAVPAFRVLCVGSLLFTFGYSTGVAMNAKGLSRPMLVRQALGGLAVVALMLLGSPWELGGMSVGRALGSGVFMALYLGLAFKVIGYGMRDIHASVREALPASIAAYAAAVLAGAGLELLRPALAPPAAAAANDKAGLAWVLAVQVAAGALAYLAVVWFRGVRPLAELRSMRGK